VAKYLIQCVTTQNPHSHILSAQVRKWNGSTYDDSNTMTVGTVRSMLTDGDVFQTFSRSTNKFAEVHKATCSAYGCTFDTIRSAADAIADNNLDNMICP
jgi:hypothetical protein